MVELEEIHCFKDKIFQSKYSKKKLMKKKELLSKITTIEWTQLSTHVFVKKAKK